MTPVSLFPFAETWWVYGVFVLFVCGMLVFDLGVFYRKAHAVGFREAAAWSVAWVFVAMCVGAVLYLWASARFAVDERLIMPETRYEVIDGHVVHVSPAPRAPCTCA